MANNVNTSQRKPTRLSPTRGTVWLPVLLVVPALPLICRCVAVRIIEPNRSDLYFDISVGLAVGAVLSLIAGVILAYRRRQDKSTILFKKLYRIFIGIVGIATGVSFALAGGSSELWELSLRRNPLFFAARFLLFLAGAMICYGTVKWLGGELSRYFPIPRSDELPQLLESDDRKARHHDLLGEFRAKHSEGKLSLDQAKGLVIDLLSYKTRETVRENVSFQDDYVLREVKIEPKNSAKFLVLSCPEKGDPHRVQKIENGGYRTIRHLAAPALFVECLELLFREITKGRIDSQEVDYAEHIRTVISSLPFRLEYESQRVFSAREESDDMAYDAIVNLIKNFEKDENAVLFLAALEHLRDRRPYLAYMERPTEGGFASFSYIEHPTELIRTPPTLNWVQSWLRMSRAQILGLEAARAVRCDRYVLDFESPVGTYVAEVGTFDRSTLKKRCGATGEPIAERASQRRPHAGWLHGMSREGVYDGFRGWQLTVGARRARFTWIRAKSDSSDAGAPFPILYLRLRESHPNGLDLAFGNSLISTLTIWICGIAGTASPPAGGTAWPSIDIPALLVASQALFFTWRTSSRRTPRVSHSIRWEYFVLFNSILSIFALCLHFGYTRGILDEVKPSPVGEFFLLGEALWQILFLISGLTFLLASIGLTHSYREFESVKKFAPRTLAPSKPFDTDQIESCDEYLASLSISKRAKNKSWLRRWTS